jgi:hypothetical protein
MFYSGRQAAFAFAMLAAESLAAVPSRPRAKLEALALRLM